ncbi:MAG: BrnT family toxin [Saccharofermentans sp.]|jgi:uncharacterized DUF497 family protein|nr:BrnT family toxin [Saccharofermentans sp.]
MTFEWDENKNQTNLKKHGIDFETASWVFNDAFRIEYYDNDHSTDEDRYIVIGEINYKTLVLYVSYTERSDVIRLISARKATASERRKYYDSKERN